MKLEIYRCPECGHEIKTTWSNNMCGKCYPKRIRMIKVDRKMGDKEVA